MTALRLRWFARFEFPDPAEEDRWYRGPDGIGVVIDLLAGTALWSRLDVLGRAGRDQAARRGRPRRVHVRARRSARRGLQ
jgi:hypothetical protein